MVIQYKNSSAIKYFKSFVFNNLTLGNSLHHFSMSKFLNKVTKYREKHTFSMVVSYSLSDLDNKKIGAGIIELMILVGLGSFLDGYDLLNISNALPLISKSFAVTPLIKGLVGYVAYGGGIIGAAGFGFFADKIGKRTIFIADLIFFVVGSLFSAFSTNGVELIAFRLLIGIGIGADIVTAPILLGDMAPSKRRGLLMGTSAAMWPTGALASVGVTYGLIAAGIAPVIAWRWLLGLAVIPAIAVIILRSRVPESPRWLLANGKYDDYKRVMAKLLNVKPEDVTIPQKRKKMSITALFTKFGKPTTYSMIAWIIAGSVPISAYIPTLLIQIGHLNEFGALKFTAIYWGAALIGVAVGATLMDKIGRKFFFGVAAMIMVVVDIIFGLTYKTIPASELALLGAFINFGDFLSVSVAYTIQAEVFPAEAKSTGGGLGFGVNRLDNFVLGTFLPIFLAVGLLGNYIIYIGAAVFILMIIALYSGKETKQLSLETIGMEEVASNDIR
ncbi:MAG: MFS transporter [Candidatus Micrarchaeaceae archaeon]